LWTLLLTTLHSVIEASFIPSHYGRAAHTGGKPRIPYSTVRKHARLMGYAPRQQNESAG